MQLCLNIRRHRGGVGTDRNLVELIGNGAVHHSVWLDDGVDRGSRTDEHLWLNSLSSLVHPGGLCDFLRYVLTSSAFLRVDFLADWHVVG